MLELYVRGLTAEYKRVKEMVPRTISPGVSAHVSRSCVPYE